MVFVQTFMSLSGYLIKILVDSFYPKLTAPAKLNI